MKFDQKVDHSLFVGCIPCLLQTWTLSSNHALYSLGCQRLSSVYISYAGCTPCSLFFCWTLYSFHVVYSTLQKVIFFIYMQGVFLAVCPQIMWCASHYRGISSCLNLCGQFIIRLLASILSLTDFPCPIYFMIVFVCVLSSFWPMSGWDSFSRMDTTFRERFDSAIFLLPPVILVLGRDIDSTFSSRPCSIQPSCTSCSQ